MSASAIAIAHRPHRDLPATVTLGPAQLVVDSVALLLRSVSRSSRVPQMAREEARVVAARRASRPSA